MPPDRLFLEELLRLFDELEDGLLVRIVGFDRRRVLLHELVRAGRLN